MATLKNSAGPRKSPDGGSDVPQSFLPVPERVSQFLELKADEVRSQMQSAKGREKLYAQLLKYEDQIREEYPDFHPEVLKSQLDEIGRTLAAKEKFAKTDHEKGLFRRAIEGVGSFAYKHPLATILLVLAVAAGGIATSAYMAGGIEALLARVGLSHLYGAEGAAAAAEELGKVIEGGKEILPELYKLPSAPDTY